jgi:hypothetical protein
MQASMGHGHALCLNVVAAGEPAVVLAVAELLPAVSI